MQYPRFLNLQLLTALADRPAVLLIGARQTGKTTLVQAIARDNRARYISLDDLTIRGAIQHDPHGFLANHPEPLIIDEIQLAPTLLPAIKLEIDRDRRPGRFLLTGSANILTLPHISESLAGRMEILTLFPLSQGEIANQKESFIDWVFAESLETNLFRVSTPIEFGSKIVAGGYPEVIQKTDVHRRGKWFRDYITTILQRDVRDLANIDGLTQMPRLLELLATRLAGLLNFSEVSRSIQIPMSSLKRYLALFEATFLTFYLPAWSGNLGKRIIKAPKLFFTDTGLAAYLLGEDLVSINQHSRLSGVLLENFVIAELQKQQTWSRIQPHLFHFRSQTNQEVDVILENRRRQCVGIEIKAAATIRPDDFKGLKWLQENLGKQFLRGMVLYTGQHLVPFGADLFAVPIQALWKIPAND